jgi:tRNA(Arg) A34 adenosine deaminase TadA
MRNMLASEARLQLPQWLVDQIPSLQGKYPDQTTRMELAISLARQNVELKSGGPFGAAVFEESSGELISVGVNLVESCNASIAHAEVVAITMAQMRLNTFNLASEGRKLQLLTSAEPCAMCLAAIPWSGVHSVICAARDADVRAIGFDEGYKPSSWQKTLEYSGISATADVQREQAVAVLERYRDAGGQIYNT